MMRMRFIIMHKTNAHWEAGAIPDPELIARVGALLGELAKDGVLVSAEGLRASSEGVRLRFAGGHAHDHSRAPSTGATSCRPASASCARDRSTMRSSGRRARPTCLGDGEIDIRPVTEPWDIGMARRPATSDTRRYMVLRKATAATEAGERAVARTANGAHRLIDETTRTGVHLVTETMRPSRRGRRYTNSRDGVSFYDGPFTETKELIAGYVVVSTPSLEDAGRWAGSTSKPSGQRRWISANWNETEF